MDQTEVDIIFLDNDLADGEGADFVNELARSKTSRVPVVMETDLQSPFMFAKAEEVTNVMNIWTRDDFVEPSVREVLHYAGTM